MKKNLLPAPRGLDGACAGFALAGFWQEYKAPILLVVVAAAVMLALFIWLARRRRPEATPDFVATAPPAPPDLGMTQIEMPPDSGERKPSPGIHGKIEVQVGGQQISTYLVTDNPLPVGRDPGQALVLIQEPIVSKLHCQIFARGGEVIVKDLNSTNGVYVNEEKISERALQDGDVVFLGKKGTVRIIYYR